MTQLLRTFGYGVTLAAIFALILISGGAANAQQDPAADQLLTPEQLDDLVAPIALYPDPLISQVLVASTYPLEIVEASQWLQRNPNVSGTALTQAAVNQDWDPSIQALVVFPDVLKYLMEDIAWTTNLGNAFLVQEGDVMDAIQRMRDRAARLGKLKTTPEQQVIHVIDEGQPVYEIIPTNPTVIYVPVYDPYYIWGSALYYPYPRWYYPPYANHVYFNRGIYIDAYYGSGWYGSISYGPTYRAWNSWGWRPAWNTRTVVVNNVFIDNHYHNASRPRSVSVATTSWSHDASHRRGVIYPNTASYDRYRRDPRDVARPQMAQGQNRSGPAQVAARSTGSTNNSRTDGRSDGRLDSRQDSRQVTRQDTRPDARQETRTDTRVAGRDTPPNSSNRDNRVDSNSRNDRGNSNVNTNRTTSAPAQVATSLPTHVTPAQVTLERQARQAAAPAPDMSRQRGPAQDQQNSRENRSAQNAGTSMTRQSSGQSREAPAARTAAPAVSQVSTVRQSSPSRSAAPEVRNSPAQESPRASVSQGSQRSQPSQMVQASPRQSAPDRGVSSESRRAPAQQTAPSSNVQSGRSSNGGGNGGSSNGGGSNGSSHGSNGGGNGGGNSKGRR